MTPTERSSPGEPPPASRGSRSPTAAETNGRTEGRPGDPTADRAGGLAADGEVPGTSSYGWRLLLAVLRRLPQGLLSRGTGRVAGIPLPAALRGPLIGGFARLVGIDRAEAEHRPAAYPSVAAYFTRALAPGVRRWPAEPERIASPVDGVVGAFGRIRAGVAIQAKGLRYSVGELLAVPAEAERFEGGFFLTLYLAPRHYHRIHAPAGGELRAARAVPGALLPVNGPAVSSLPRLLPRNERLVVHLRTGGNASAAPGDVALVAVGAFNVGRISAAFDPGWNGADGRGVTNRPRAEPETRVYTPPRPVARGEELMTFHLGSTVVLLLGPTVTEGRSPGPALAEGREIRLGTPLFAREEGRA